MLCGEVVGDADSLSICAVTKYSKEEWQFWEQLQKETEEKFKKLRSLNAVGQQAASAREKGERVDCTLDSGCCACVVIRKDAKPFGLACGGRHLAMLGLAQR